MGRLIALSPCAKKGTGILSQAGQNQQEGEATYHPTPNPRCQEGELTCQPVLSWLYVGPLFIAVYADMLNV